MPAKPPLYIFSVPSSVGGAGTKVRDIIRMLGEDFDISLWIANVAIAQAPEVRDFLRTQKITPRLRKDFPRQVRGTALGVCEGDFFVSGLAERIKSAGAQIVWSNDMMWEFSGEAAAAGQGLVDRVLFVSEHQQEAFSRIYERTDQRVVPNYVNPADFPLVERRNETFTIGRLSRADPAKYPIDFPVFYEELGLDDTRFRVQAWDDQLRRIYSWHRFGAEWELLPANKIPAAKFLASLDLFVYPLGHKVVESWGRVVAEAMLSGCVPLVPSGHHFHKMLNHGESGFVCDSFEEFKEHANRLRNDCPLRDRMAQCAAEHARNILFREENHRRLWRDVLTFN
jgi:glycosyltransferase involved in cell wall biosynthesis